MALLENGNNRESSARVLAFADSQNDVSVQIGAIQELGQLRRPLYENEITFIRKHLESNNQYVRKKSVESVGRLSGAVRSTFLTLITRIATDPHETEETRSLANHVLTQ